MKEEKEIPDFEVDEFVSEKEEKEPIYVAFDSNIISYLSTIHKLKSRGVEIERGKMQNEWIKKNLSYLLRLYDKIVAGEVKPVVLDTVYQETKMIPMCKKFISNFAYFPNYNQANKQEKREEILQLVNKYCSPYVNPINGKEFPPAMDKRYCAATMKDEPENDAFLIAEATVENLVFVTANESDFIMSHSDKWHNKNLKEGENIRANRRQTIINVNKDNGYMSDDGNVPRPEAFGAFMYHLLRDNFNATKPKNAMRRAEIEMQY